MYLCSKITISAVSVSLELFWCLLLMEQPHRFVMFWVLLTNPRCHLATHTNSTPWLHGQTWSKRNMTLDYGETQWSIVLMFVLRWVYLLVSFKEITHLLLSHTECVLLTDLNPKEATNANRITAVSCGDMINVCILPLAVKKRGGHCFKRHLKTL